jgi:hypothetical protein
MAHTDIAITNQDGNLIADMSSLTVTAGHTFSIAASGGGVVLFFSPDVIQVLSPQPSGPVTIDDGGQTAFAFTSSGDGAYRIAFGTADVLEHPGFSDLPSNGSTLEIVVVMPPRAVAAATNPRGGTGPVLNPQGGDTFNPRGGTGPVLNPQGGDALNPRQGN